MSVLVYTENWDGKFKKLSFELVSYASRVAEMMNTSSVAISIGDVSEDELRKLGNYGVSRIISVKSPGIKTLDSRAFARVISEEALKTGATVIVISNNNQGRSLAPRVSVRLKAGVGAGVSKLPVSLDPFTVVKRVFSGNAFAHVEIRSEIKILTLAQNSFGIIESPANPTIESAGTGIDGSLFNTELHDVQKQAGKLLLTDAEIVVSGGRGMKSSENWGPLEELASLLGAATACSRPVSDEGWRPHDEHTGQTGKIIAPNLYIAIGISGATQHIAGVSSSKYIVAINSDKDAPIFESAQFGIIGDAQKILPVLVEAVKAAK